MLANIVRLVSLVLSLLLCTDGGRNRYERLNEFIAHHEVLSYPSAIVHAAHTRHKRALPEDREHVQINFVAHGRSFTLLLEQDHSIFHKEYYAEGPRGESLAHLDHTHYHGEVKDEPGSQVYGSIRDGVFDGTVHTRRDGTFYVERSHRYLPYTSNSSIHSVIYHDSHVNSPRQGGGCAADPATKEWLERVQNSAVPEVGEKLPLAAPLRQTQQEINNNLKSPLPFINRREEVPERDPDTKYRWTEEANTRSKRRIPSNKKSCSLFIQTDPLLWKHIWRQERLRLPDKNSSEIDAKEI